MMQVDGYSLDSVRRDGRKCQSISFCCEQISLRSLM